MESDPPFQKVYKTLFREKVVVVEEEETAKVRYDDEDDQSHELPLIDISRLKVGGGVAEECKREIAEASKKWGFFQVVNHGISREVLEKMGQEQVKLFGQPFEKKANEKLLACPSDIYRWGTPSATCLMHFSWSEAFHIPLTPDVSVSSEFHLLRFTIEEFAATVSKLAEKIAEVLAECLGHEPDFFTENCSPDTCYLRLNRYPPCPISSAVFGLMPHTDSDFLTILYQDQVGGLELVKDGRWIKVKPNPEALVINIGDLFQAWSNGVYKSVEHRVMTNQQVERYSVAFFYCPSYDTVIQSRIVPPMYREFSFREYRQQVQDDVRTLGQKVGLPRFLLYHLIVLFVGRMRILANTVYNMQPHYINLGLI